MQSCSFCNIIAGRLPAEILFRDERVVVFKDLHPQAPIHLLIIPVKHIESLLDFSRTDSELMAELLLRAQETAHELGLGKNGFRLVINTGRDAGQAVYHIHVHLLAGRSMHWPPG